MGGGSSNKRNFPLRSLSALLGDSLTSEVWLLAADLFRVQTLSKETNSNLPRSTPDVTIFKIEVQLISSIVIIAAAQQGVAQLYVFVFFFYSLPL